MAIINVNNCNLYYEIHGSGEQTIMLSHGMLWSTFMYKKQIEFFKNRYKVIAYDHRGQGKSQYVAGADYSMDQLTDDSVALIEKLNLGKVHFCGLSMGGFVGMRLAARRPDLVKSLILFDSSAQGEQPKQISDGRKLFYLIKIFGFSPFVSYINKSMYGETFNASPKRKADKELFDVEMKRNKRSIAHTVKAVVNRKPITDELKNIKCPTLVVVGDEDRVTAPGRSKFIHENIPQSRFVTLLHCGHMATVEEPEQCNEVIDGFLKSL